MNFVVKTFDFGSSWYQQELRLRQAVLRNPLGLALSSQDTQSDSRDLHLGVVLGDQLIGCCLLHFLDGDTNSELTGRTVRMRQVAVEPNHQGAGVGRALAEHFEILARKHHATKIVLYARETAVPFYQRLGYKVTGPSPAVSTLPHFEMQKDLEPRPPLGL